MNKAQQKETYYLNRLIKLRDVFKAAEKIKDHVYVVQAGGKRIFDIANWATTNDHESDKLDENICGTACCVAGTAGFIPEFRKAGLKTEINKYGEGSVVLRSEDDYDNASEYAFAEFFGLTLDESMNITMPSAYVPEFGTSDPNPKMVVKRLNDYIKAKKNNIKMLGKK